MRCFPQPPHSSSPRFQTSARTRLKTAAVMNGASTTPSPSIAAVTRAAKSASEMAFKLEGVKPVYVA
eukprot:CAMPEP_0182824630 /NCGR_PEP_ID=MMETSP0006_2-20121128/15395_1 /TAXON_ID=97485 /ORGANISM="Prymnesium parvum, Strain Texoma1" /LENGTH=66 /DNA_ID=CAMNT_0024951645 /DNA_START=251 /DNA_END=451 /DNA_ORIENTATION=-